MDKIAVVGAGVWAYRREIAHITGCEPVYVKHTAMPPAGVKAVAGWGYKPVLKDPRAFAQRHGLQYLAFEDGFLRSVYPGPTSPALSLFFDDTGMYYDRYRTSRLDRLIEQRKGLDNRSVASQIIAQLKTLRLSKYNAFDPAHVPCSLAGIAPGTAVLIVDQTQGDVSISGAGADPGTFEAMMSGALSEAGERPILVKVHPEVVNGRKSGCVPHSVLSDARVRVLSEPVCPWLLLDLAEEVHCVSSQLGLEALMAGCAVHCWGRPFFSQRGLTMDRGASDTPQPALAGLDDLIAAVYLDYAFYFDAWTRQPISFFRACEQLAYLRQKLPQQAPSWQNMLPRELHFLMHRLFVLPERPVVSRV